MKTQVIDFSSPRPLTWCVQLRADSSTVIPQKSEEQQEMWDIILGSYLRSGKAVITVHTCSRFCYFQDLVLFCIDVFHFRNFISLFFSLVSALEPCAVSSPGALGH